MLKRQNVIIPHPCPEICGLFIQKNIKSRTNSGQRRVSLLFRSHYTIFTSCSSLFSLQQLLFCQSCLLLITLFILLPLLWWEKCWSLWHEQLQSSRFLWLSQHETCSQKKAITALFITWGPFCKAICSITVVVCPNNTSNEQQIHNCVISMMTSTSRALLSSAFINVTHVICPEIQPS